MNIVDMLVHVHPELDAQLSTDLERKLMGRVGVDCAEFERKQHPHSIMLKYDPDAIEGMAILQMIRKVDPVASRVQF